MRLLFIFPFKNNIWGGPFKWLPLSSPTLVAYLKNIFPNIKFNQIDLEEEILSATRAGRLDKKSILSLQQIINMEYDNFLKEILGNRKSYKFLEEIIQLFNIDHYDHYFFAIYNYDIAGVKANILLSKYLKNKFPKKNIVFGGQGLFNFGKKKMLMRVKKDLECIDSFVRFDGEKATEKLIWDLIKKKNLKNIYQLKTEKKIKIKHLPDFKTFGSLNHFSHTNEEIELFYNINLFNNKKNNKFLFIPYFFSIGCPYANCAYCPSGDQEPYVYHKSIAQIIKDIKTLKKKHKTKYFIFFNDNFNFNFNFSKKLLKEIISSRLDILWTDSFNLKIMDEEMIELLPKAGCFRADIGWSIVNPKLQKKYNNIIQGEKNLINLKKLSDKGIWNHINLILNLPHQFSIEKDLEIIGKHSEYIDGVTFTDYIRFYGSKIDKNYNDFGLMPVDKEVGVSVKGETFANRLPVLSFLEKNFKGSIKDRKKIYSKIHNEYLSFFKKNGFMLQRIHLYLLGVLYNKHGYNKSKIKKMVKNADKNIQKHKYYNNYLEKTLIEKEEHF